MINNNYKYVWINKLIALSLIELLITMSIVSVLLGISYSTLSSLKLESHRKEAHSELIKLKANIEQTALSGWMNGTPVSSYIDVATILNGQNKTITTPNGYYNIKVSSVSKTGTSSSYTLTATAVGVQAKDTACPTIALIISADTSGVSEDTRTPTQCW